MSKTIYKYPIESFDYQTIQLPEGAKVINADMQNNKVCLWALVDTENAEQDYTSTVNVYAFMTGQLIIDNMEDLRHIKTLLLDSYKAQIVIHIYIDKEF